MQFLKIVILVLCIIIDTYVYMYLYIRIILLYFGWRDFFVSFIDFDLCSQYMYIHYVLRSSNFRTYSNSYLLQVLRDILSSRVSQLHIASRRVTVIMKSFYQVKWIKCMKTDMTRRRWRKRQRRRRRRNKQGVAGGNRKRIRPVKLMPH